VRRSSSLLVVLALGCGAASPTTSTPEGDPLDPQSLFPMPLGTQWVYDVQTDPRDPPTLGIFEVIEAEGNRRVIANNRGMVGGEVQWAEPVTYELSAEGIRRDGAWWLRAPIEVGATWQTIGGRRAEVLSVDRTVEVFAGTFEGCVEIEETGDRAGRRFHTIYCPGQGPTRMQTQLSTTLTMQTVETIAELRSFFLGSDQAE
jgi:hypothetical protein